MTITIHNIKFNKDELMNFVNNGEKIQAIKLIKDKTRLGLKECKDIVDHLSDNPSFYDDKDYVSDKGSVEIFEKPNRLRNKRGSYIIENKSNSKNYIILFLLFVIVILIYLYINK